MKKLTLMAIGGIIAATVLLATSCYPTARMYVEYLDYAKYYEDGFLISPASVEYNGDYEPRGELVVEFTPGYSDVAIPRDSLDQGCEYREHPESTKLVYPWLGIDDMMDAVVAKARSNGADGIINFKAVVVRNLKDGAIAYFEYSGFCIKRNDK